MIKIPNEQLHEKYLDYIASKFKFKLEFENYSFLTTRISSMGVRIIEYDVLISIDNYKFIRTFTLNKNITVQVLTTDILNIAYQLVNVIFKEEIANINRIESVAYKGFNRKYTHVVEELAKCLIENFNTNDMLS